MANLISVSVLKYGNEEFGTTAADAKTMLLSTEHIIYGTNVETALGIDATVATAATDALTITAHGLTSGEYIRVGNLGNAVGNFDIASSDYTPGKIFRQKITGADNVFLHGSEAHYAADTKQDITTGATGMALPVFRVQGELLYADTQNNGRPVIIRTVEPCVNMADGFGMSDKSNQLRIVEVNSKNGVVYDADTILEGNLMINLDRVIMTYEGAIAAGAASDKLGSMSGGASADDWATWYDASNTNCAGMDSPHCDILNIETSLDGLMTSFVQHLGGKTELADMATLTVNGNRVAFPDTSVSGIVRLKNIICAHDSTAVIVGPGDTDALAADKAQLKLKATGKSGYDTLSLDSTIADNLTKTESALTT